MQYDMALIGNRPKPVYIEATITNFTKGGAAFAREANGMRDIFVPVAVAERMELDRGDQVIATTVPNRLYESWTPDLGVLRPAEGYRCGDWFCPLQVEPHNGWQRPLLRPRPCVPRAGDQG